MKIAVIGAGAMGSIYGGHLSEHNEVLMIDTNPEVVKKINENGIRLQLGPYDFVFGAGTVKGTFFVITLDKTSHVVLIHIDGAVVWFVLFIIFIVCAKITTGHTKFPLLL